MISGSRCVQPGEVRWWVGMPLAFGLFGRLALDQVDVAHAAAMPEVWEKVVQKLRSRTMPPPRRPRPDDATYDALATWLESSLDAAAAAHPNPGRPLLHRMNRAEYHNAVRDLLAVEKVGMLKMGLDPAEDTRFYALAIEAFGERDFEWLGSHAVYDDWLNIGEAACDLVASGDEVPFFHVKGSFSAHRGVVGDPCRFALQLGPGRQVAAGG